MEDKVIRVKIWDTAGQEQYKSLTRNFYRNSDGIVIVYDVTNKESLIRVQEWIEAVSDNTDKRVKMILVGNKIDMHREVSSEEGKKMADAYGIQYFEASAKERIGIDEAMKAIITEVVQDKKPKKDITINLGDSNANSESKGCGC